MTAPEITLARHVPELALDWMHSHPGEHWRLIEGTLCFADISGFTRLAERLAQRGRRGGEELVETLSRVFGTMLDVAHDNGGGLLKFGGDALLLFFSGDGHALRAANTAIQMRAALREAAKIPTSVGKLNLSMSVGLHSGDVHFLLVGSTHRELVILGPAASKIIETEGAANAGQILTSPATAAALPTSATRPTGEHLELRWRTPKPAPAFQPVSKANSTDARSLFPEVLGEHLASAVPDPEHRIACIAFMRASGTDALLAESGPDALAEAVNTTIGRAQEIFAEEGVTLLAVDVDKDGFKLFLGAGVPHALEDDEGVMLRAARRVADADLPLPMQIGLNRGHVFAAEVGTRRRAAYSAMGDTTNTAARICAKAPIGSIYAHPQVLDESLTTFEVTPSEPLIMKGKAEPLVVYDVGALTGVRAREGLEVETFVGRSRELAQLTDLVDKLLSGTGGAMSIVGDSGLGKSRLLAEALGRFDAPPALELRPEPYAATRQFRTLRDQLRGVLGIEPAAPEEMTAALLERIQALHPDLLPFAALIGDVTQIDVEPSDAVLTIDPQYRLDRTAAVLVELLEKQLDGPQIFTIDDAHWCDEASTRMLGGIADAAHYHPWLVLAARRELPGGFELPEQLALGPMEREDMEALVKIATEAAPLRPHEFELVLERASGNPLFATEIIQAARSASSLESLPTSLEAALAARVDNLDPPARQLLRYGSVLGRSFPADLLERLMDAAGETFDAAIVDRLDQFLETDGERVRFRNGVVRDSVYEAMAFRLRTRLHAAAAEVIERSNPDPTIVADTLANHFHESGNHEATWTYALIAADGARDANANADAAKLYGLALSAARQLRSVEHGELARTWLSLSEVDTHAGLLEAGMEALVHAQRNAREEPLLRAKVFILKAVIRNLLGQFSPALRDYTGAANAIRDIDEPEANQVRADIMAKTAYVLIYQNKPKAGLLKAQEAADYARSVGAPRPLAQALIAQEICKVNVDGGTDGEKLREALPAAEDAGDLSLVAEVKMNLGFVMAHSGRWNEAAKWIAESRELLNAIGHTVNACMTALNLSEMLMKQRRFRESEDVLDDVLRSARAANFQEGVNRAEMQLGRILVEHGEYDQAEAMLSRVIDAFNERGQPLVALEATVNRAYGARERGDPNEAIDMLQAALAKAGPEAEGLRPAVSCELGPALAAAGRSEDALEEIESGMRIAQARHMPYEEALLAMAQAEVHAVRGMQTDLKRIKAASETLTALGVVT